MDKLRILKEYFGHEEFREGQEALIDSILSGRDVLGIMPTGAGKSVCYQLPALMMDGITLVVSPLISLMKDQVSSLVQAGVKAAFINSSLSSAQYTEVFRRAYSGAYKIIYITPERLMTEGFIAFAEKMKIAMITVDEAHCVSQWGQDFRPSYLKIIEFAEKLSYRPVISAFTATATSEVKDDIRIILRLNDPFMITTGFDRKNLYFGVLSPRDKFGTLLSIIEKNSGRCGIVYCLARKTVEEVCDKLNDAGICATRYHAGLSEKERRCNQEDFIYDRKSVMVATNAFGMGIDKSDVAFVVHYNMPKNLESYYQEAGRAGRDGEPAECTLLYSGMDVRTNRFLIEHSDAENSDLTEEMRRAVREKDYERLKMMTFYCTTNECLREFILRYFGEKSPAYCGNCSNCDANYETVDVTVDAQKILSCICRVLRQGKSFGKSMITEILRGAKSERIKANGFEELSTYGIMAGVPSAKIRAVIDFLAENGYIALTGGEYETLKLTAKSEEILRGGKRVEMKLPKSIKPDILIKHKTDEKPADSVLFMKLKELRAAFAAEEHVPAYIVFSDSALHDMCRKMPTGKAEFLNVSGVGSRKAEKYSDAFCGVIKSHIAESISGNITAEEPPKESLLDKLAGKSWSADEDGEPQKKKRKLGLRKAAK